MCIPDKRHCIRVLVSSRQVKLPCFLIRTTTTRPTFKKQKRNNQTKNVNSGIAEGMKSRSSVISALKLKRNV